MENVSSNKMFNTLAQYEIIGRIPNGTYIVGYVLNNRITGEQTMVQKGVVEQLALNKNIYNANAQIYNNVVNLKGINCKISKLPKYYANGELIKDNEKSNKVSKPFLRIVGRVQSSREICAYIIEYKDKNNKIARIRVDKDKVINYAKNGYIENAKVQFNGGELMLRGVNEDLTTLKKFKDNGGTV